MRILRLIGLLLLILTGWQLKAQDFSLPKGEGQPASPEIHDFGFFGAGAGIAFPLGSFGSKDYLNNGAGYADEGYFINFINFHHRLSKHYGIGVNWTRSAFNLDEDQYISPYDDFYQELTFLGINIDPWVLHSVMVNGVVTIPHSFLDLDVRIALGLGHAVRPKLTITAFETSTGYLAIDWVQEQSVMNDFAWGFGTDARFHVLKDLDFFITLDYLRFHTTFNVQNVYNFSSIEQEKMKQTIEMIQLGVGFGYRLN